jgi:hypothetical protein
VFGNVRWLINSSHFHFHRAKVHSEVDGIFNVEFVDRDPQNKTEAKQKTQLIITNSHTSLWVPLNSHCGLLLWAEQVETFLCHFLISLEDYLPFINRNTLYFGDNVELSAHFSRDRTTDRHETFKQTENTSRCCTHKPIKHLVACWKQWVENRENIVREKGGWASLKCEENIKDCRFHWQLLKIRKQIASLLKILFFCGNEKSWKKFHSLSEV